MPISFIFNTTEIRQVQEWNRQVRAQVDYRIRRFDSRTILAFGKWHHVCEEHTVEEYGGLLYTRAIQSGAFPFGLRYRSIYGDTYTEGGTFPCGTPRYADVRPATPKTSLDSIARQRRSKADKRERGQPPVRYDRLRQ